MRTWKIILALLLALLMVVSVVACGGGDSGKETPKATDPNPSDGESTPGGSSGETDPSGSDTDPATDPGPAPEPTVVSLGLDYGDEVVRFLWKDDDVRIEDPDEGYNDSDIIEKAIYERQCTVEDGLNVVLDGEFGLGNGEVNSKVNAEVKSGSGDFDYINGHMKFNGSLGAQGFTFNMAALPYVNMEADCWNQVYGQHFNYRGVQIWGTGDIVKDFLSEITVVFVNDSLYEKYSGGSIDDLFAIVERGEWTYDKAIELISDVYEDVNGNSNGGTYDPEDVYGWSYDAGWAVASMVYAGGYDMTVKEGSKWKLDLASTHNVEVFAKAFDLMNNANFQLERTNGEAWSSFCNGLRMFYHQTLDNCEKSTLQEAGFNFSIIPLPKYSEDDDYRTHSYDGVPVVGVVSTVKEDRREMVGAVLQAMAEEGKTVLTEAYFEVALRAKYATNEGSSKCMKLIREKAAADFAFCWTGSLNQIDLFITNLIVGGNSNISGAAQAQQSAYQKLLDSLYGNLNKVYKANKS